MLAEQLQQVINNQPEAIAISDPRRGNITYAQLWEYVCATSANIGKILGNDKYVGIVADQDAHSVIACISAILSGKAIIPIDPRHDARLAEQMLRPFTTKIVNGTSKSFDKTFDVFSLEDVIDNGNSSFGFDSSDTDAYILHTSGTTGRPKPVLAKQSALSQVSKALAERYHIKPGSKVLQFAYLSFDSSLIEIWSTLLCGGTIVVPGNRLREDLYGCLEDLLRTKQITTATLPSTIANNIAEGDLTNLETLILAGDELPAELANRLYKNIPHLINAYGPTESIICATTYEVHEQQTARVPIGKPLPGMEIIIENADESGQGEMLLVSSYLASCYANDAERTKEKFGVNANGKRYYRSGDIGRILKSGDYEFLGRVDNQVKINGQRIELEGVEAQIRNIVQKNDIAVVAVDNKLYCLYGSETRLPELEDVAAKLRGTLPDYAIPSNFIPIKEIPLDFNGKINRKSLATMVEEGMLQDQSKQNKNGNESNTMIELWSRLLNIPSNKISHDSNFFSLGGDSLGALSLVKTINDQYAVNVKLSELITSPATPASMSAVVEQSKAKII